MSKYNDFFYKYHSDPLALYDDEGNRFFTGGSEHIERWLYVKKLLTYR